MQTGFGLLEVLVSEFTMVIGALMLLLCGGLLLFRRKSMSGPAKTAAVIGTVLSGAYVAFILWLVCMWG